MNKDKLDIPHPDPGWDYYILWYSLHHIKAKVDEALQTMNHIEKATPEIDKQIHDVLDLASDKLIDIVHSLEHEDEE